MSFGHRLRGLKNPVSSRDQQRVIAPMYTALRDEILSLDPASIHIQPTTELPDVFGIVMDWSLGNALATIVSLADRTTSMYFSSGGGTIGAGEHKAPAAASINAVHLAQSTIADFPSSPAAPLPGPGRSALTLLTFSGMRRIEEDTAEFQGGSTGPSRVANAMQEVISAIGMIQEGQS